ncbi:Site-specific recombinase XerC [Caballeronia sordidicola]|uniref:Site-specific recombinase XerC n=1 Tax=Caballeronia sordidicola TaxID=196367 RepID=A0A226WSQ6_CABSO|nr:Site-specific recombinase XerC [Caballeronia sordidicola]
MNLPLFAFHHSPSSTFRPQLKPLSQKRGPLYTAYLKNGGTLENAAMMANHASTRTTQLYDRRHDEINLDEVERIRV